MCVCVCEVLNHFGGPLRLEEEGQETSNSCGLTSNTKNSEREGRLKKCVRVRERQGENERELGSLQFLRSEMISRLLEFPPFSHTTFNHTCRLEIHSAEYQDMMVSLLLCRIDNTNTWRWDRERYWANLDRTTLLLCVKVYFPIEYAVVCINPSTHE